MYTLLTPSAIRRVLLQKSESGKGQDEIATGDEAIYVKSPEQDGQHVISGQSEQLLLEDGRDDQKSRPESMLPSELPCLLPTVSVDDAVGAGDHPSLFSDIMVHSNGSSAAFSFDSLHAITPSDPFECFVEQVVNSLTTNTLHNTNRYLSAGIESQQRSLSPLNHYHPDSDFSNLEQGEHFSESLSLSGHYYLAENHHDPAYEQAGSDDFVEQAEMVRDILSGERLNTADDDWIHFYDGEPIEIGVPVVLEPTEGGVGASVAVDPPTHLQGDESNRFSPVNLFEEYGNNIVLTFNGDKHDLDFSLDLSRLNDKDMVLFEDFKLGHDTLQINSVLDTETMPTLWDNEPKECVGKEGVPVLCFSVEGNRGVECTVVFAGMTYEDYMEFLSSAVQKVAAS